MPSVDEPVSLEAYDPQWPMHFTTEAARLLEVLQGSALGIEHIGSTAVPGLAAKPIVDVMVGVANLERSQDVVDRLTLLGYEDCGGVVGRHYLRRREGQHFNVQIIEELLRVARLEVVEDARKRTVQLGYDAIAERYLAWGGRVEGDPRDRFLEALAQRLPDGVRVLDLGCGAGLPSTRQLARRFDVVGVDISQTQLGLAHKNVPNATFIHGDIATLDMPEASFDGITALYSISHVPRDEHAALFGRIATWLKPGGFLLASLGAAGSPDWTGEWLGVPMFFSSHDADTNRKLIRDTGLKLVIDEVVSMQEPEGEAAFLWVLAQKPAA